MHRVVAVDSKCPIHLDDVVSSGKDQPEEIDKIEAIIQKHDVKRSSLISILLGIQQEYNYLPKEALKQVSRSLNIPLSEIYGIATYYKAFYLKPRGKYVITVCVGTACHVHGGARIAELLSNSLEIEPGETSEDMMFTLETVNCLGVCALGPVLVINHEYFGEMSIGKAEKLIKKCRRA